VIESFRHSKGNTLSTLCTSIPYYLRVRGRNGEAEMGRAGEMQWWRKTWRKSEK